MLKIWIVGRGRMGGAVEAEIAACEDLALAGASEYVPEAESIGAADVDHRFFPPQQHPRRVRARAARDGTALVLGTTGPGRRAPPVYCPGRAKSARRAFGEFLHGHCDF